MPHLSSVCGCSLTRRVNRQGNRPNKGNLQANALDGGNEKGTHTHTHAHTHKQTHTDRKLLYCWQLNLESLRAPSYCKVTRTKKSWITMRHRSNFLFAEKCEMKLGTNSMQRWLLIRCYVWKKYTIIRHIQEKKRCWDIVLFGLRLTPQYSSFFSSNRTPSCALCMSGWFTLPLKRVGGSLFFYPLFWGVFES